MKWKSLFTCRPGGYIAEHQGQVNEVNEPNFQEGRDAKDGFAWCSSCFGDDLLADSSVQPLNVKPGLWDVTMNVTLNGMGAPPRTNT
jgi:hypothetical protein